MRWLLTVALLCCLALAQEAPPVYIPLDDRPPNWSPCSWGSLVRCPPSELYRGREGADPEALAAWLGRSGASRVVASLDALIYGGLVQSRSSGLTAIQARARLAALEPLKRSGRVWAFGVIPRHPDSSNRARNLEVLGTLGGGFAYLEAPWDDALPGSPAVAEAATLNIPTRPGADEAGQVLLLRALNPGLRVKVIYDDPRAPKQVTRYDGIALEQAIARLLAAAGAEPVERRPDLVLMVYSGNDPRRGVLTLLRGQREAPVAIADIARVNRGDPSLVRYLVQLNLYADLAAYASWGTPSNNLGSALAQGGLFAPTTCTLGEACAELRRQTLAQAFLEYLWGEVGRPWVRERFPEPLTEEAARYAFERLRAEPAPQFGDNRLEPLGLSFPWRRSFEARWRYQLTPLWKTIYR